MNFKTTLILIALLIGAGIFLLVDRMTSKPADDAATATAAAEEARGKKVVDLDSTAVTKLTITPASGGTKTVLTKADGKWRLVEPVAAAADQFTADDIVRGLTDLRSKGQVDKGVAGEPRYTVELTGSDKTVKLAVSEKSVVGDTMYVVTGDAAKADVVPADVYDRLDKLEDLRDKQLVSVSSQDIKQLKYKTPTTQVSLVKSDKGWEVTEPERMPADDSAVSDLLFGVTGLRASEFVKGDDKTALANPQLTVSYSTTQPSTQPASTQPTFTTVVVGRYEDIRKQNVLASIEGTSVVAKVPASVLNTFAKAPLELRDKKVLDIDPETVTQISLSSDKSTGAGGATPLVIATPAGGKKEVVLTLRPESERNPQPATAPTTAPSTQASTIPATTQATTQAATQPVTPPSKWLVKEGSGTVGADDAKVSSLLADLHPLRAEKFIPAMPTTRPNATYAITVKTGGTKGTPAVTHEITLIDRGEGEPLAASYNGLTFEVSRTIATRFDEEYAEKKPEPAATAPAPAPTAPATP